MNSTFPPDEFFGIRVTEGVPFLETDRAHFLRDRAPITPTTDGPIPIPDPSKTWKYKDLLTQLDGFPDMFAEWVMVGTLRHPTLSKVEQRTVFARRRAIKNKPNTWEIELVASYFSCAVQDDLGGHRMNEDDLQFQNMLQPLLQIRDWNLVKFSCTSNLIQNIIAFVIEKLANN